MSDKTVKVKLLGAKEEVKEFNSSYAARLIEQGKAVLVPPEKKAQAKKEEQAVEKTAQKG